jgi:hypothetical protein
VTLSLHLGRDFHTFIRISLINSYFSRYLIFSYHFSINDHLIVIVSLIISLLVLIGRLYIVRVGINFNLRQGTASPYQLGVTSSTSRYR